MTPAALAVLAGKAVQAPAFPRTETAAGEPVRRYRTGPAARARAPRRPDLPLHGYAPHLKIRPARPAR